MGAVKSDKNSQAARKATVDQVKEMKSDLRSAHFHFGNHQSDYLSAAKESLVNHDPSVSAESQKLAHELSSKMQTVSYKIGDYNQRTLVDAASMYKKTISARGQNIEDFRKDPLSTLNMKATNIKLGNENQIDYTSEAKEKFIPQAQSA